MKAVLISIKPEWCELIANGRKTVEVRKTRPKLETPFKVYIYCTKDKHGWFDFFRKTRLDGKIIGEFVCDRIIDIKPFGIDNIHEFEKQVCLKANKIVDYLNGFYGYGWHISDLVIYDRPKELSEFFMKCKKFACEGCEHLKYQRVNADEYDYECEYFHYHIPITRPPQSWRYVEDLHGVKT